MLEKNNLLGFTQQQLNEFFSQIGEKPYRTRQLMQWVYHKEVYNFN